jgi:hypothetical protein
MAAFGPGRTLWTYTTDDGTDVPFNAQTGYTAQVATLGGAAWATLPTPPLRRGFKPRCVYAVTAGGVRRKVVVYDAAAYAAIVVNTTTVQVDTGDGQQTSATVRSRQGEHHQGAGVPA